MRNCFLRDTVGSPERARKRGHVARYGSQSHRRIWFVLPPHGACHILKSNKINFSAIVVIVDTHGS